MAEEKYSSPEGVHSPLGPSSAKRWINCPGSVLLTKDMPDEDSVFSTQGTAAHTVTEWARLEGKDASEYLGRIIDVELAQGGTSPVEVDQEMVDCVNSFVEYTNSLAEPGGHQTLVEAQVSYTGWVEDGFGTADDIRLQPGTVFVTDFKYGKGVQVFAEGNEQGMLYALGVYQDFGWLQDIDKFQIAIHQPRINHIDEWTISVEDLLVWANTVAEPRSKVALAPGAEFKAGEWCQFCKAKATCKTRAEVVYGAVYDEDFEDLGPIEAKRTDPQLLTNEEIALLLPMVSTMKSFAADLEEVAYSRIAKGEEILHPRMGPYKLVEGRSNRKYNAEEETVATKLIAETTLEEDDLYTKKMKGPAALEKIIGKKNKVLKSLIEKPAGAPKLVTGTDKRDALALNVEDEFDEV